MQIDVTEGGFRAVDNVGRPYDPITTQTYLTWLASIMKNDSKCLKRVVSPLNPNELGTTKCNGTMYSEQIHAYKPDTQSNVKVKIWTCDACNTTIIKFTLKGKRYTFGRGL